MGAHKEYRLRLDEVPLRENERCPTGEICALPWYRFHTFGAGEVSACCWLYDNLADSELYRIGNLKEGGLDAAWNSEDAQLLRRRMLQLGAEGICPPHCPDFKPIETLRRGAAEARQRGNVARADALEALWEAILGGEVRLETPPMEFFLAATGLCNVDCPMCCYGGEANKSDWVLRRVDDAFYEELEARIDGVERVWLYGGEPLIAKGLLPVMQRLAAREPRPSCEFLLITNLMVLPDAWLEVMERLRFVQVSVSIDAHNAELFERVRRGSSWERLQRNWQRLRERMDPLGHVRYATQLTVQRDNWRYVDEIVEFLLGMGFHTIGVHPVQNDREGVSIWKDRACLEALRAPVERWQRWAETAQPDYPGVDLVGLDNFAAELEQGIARLGD